MKSVKIIILSLTIIAIVLCVGIYIGRSYKDGEITVHVEKSPDPKGLIDINSATVSELSVLPGISPAIARKIVEYRTERNGFDSIYDLLDVPGISYGIIDGIKDYITIKS